MHRPVAAVALAALASSGAFAATNSPLQGARESGPREARAPYVSGGSHKLVSTTENWNTSIGLTLFPGFNALDNPTSVNCANQAGCTIISQSEVQIEPGPNTQWAICIVVDGIYANPGCPYQGTMPSVGSWIVGHARTNYAVPHGAHMVQTQVYVSVSSQLGEWQTDYGVYKP